MLRELQIMFEEERAPADIADHEENCALCFAATPQEVRELLEEHKIDFDFDLLDKFEITGKLFLALNSQDVRHYFKDSPMPRKNLNSAISYMKKLHVKN